MNQFEIAKQAVLTGKYAATKGALIIAALIATGEFIYTCGIVKTINK